MSNNSEGHRTRFFTGRQVTAMVVSLMATIVLLPGAVWAVDSFTNVAIQDPITGVKARVDSGRKLTVSDGSGVLTVDGTVSAVPRPPPSPWSAILNPVGSGGQGAFIAGPSTTPINVTSLSFGFIGDGTAIPYLQGYSVPSTATTCDGASWVADLYNVRQPSTAGAFTASFPTPLQIRPPSGRKACLYANNNFTSVVLNVSGYYGS